MPSRSQKPKKAVESRRYAETVCGDTRRSTSSRCKNAVSSLCPPTIESSRDERYRYELAQTAQEIHALARMKVIRVVTPDDEESQSSILAERHHRRRAHAVRIALENRFLPIAQRTTARPSCAQKRRERPDRCVVERHSLDEARTLGACRSLAFEQTRGPRARPQSPRASPFRAARGAALTSFTRMSFMPSW